MKVINLDRKIEIWRRTTTTDVYGQKVDTFSKFRELYAQKEDVLGSVKDGEDDSQVISISNTFWTVRNNRQLGLRNTDEIRYNGDTFEIDGFQELGRNTFLKIKTKQRGQYD